MIMEYEWDINGTYIYIYIYKYSYPLKKTCYITIEHGPFIVDLPSKDCDFH